ncbi:hypothetical protein CR513_45724, partial [Mucuna pruriens]
MLSKEVNKTPYELWTGKMPSIKHLHIWGCLTEAQPYRSSFFETKNTRFLEKVQFEKEENIRNVIFKEESETTTVIEDNVQTIVPNIVLDKTMTRRTIRERRHAILDNHIFFLQKHEDDIDLIEDDPINFCVKPIGCKWIFKTKKDYKGNIERHKAYLVGKGFTQKEDID